MPTGKVKWYDAEKGFGFLSQPEGPDVYVRSDALPEGVTTLKTGARVEFGIAQGRRGDQALRRLEAGDWPAPATVTRLYGTWAHAVADAFADHPQPAPPTTGTPPGPGPH